MNEKELFLARLLCDEELRKKFLRDPKAVLKKEGLKVEDLEELPLRAILCSDKPSADGHEFCTTQCSSTCPSGPGSKIGSIIGHITNFATPTVS
jgi:hypothetical protein